MQTQITGISANAFKGLSLNALDCAHLRGQDGDFTTTQLSVMTATQADDLLGLTFGNGTAFQAFTPPPGSKP